MTKKEMWERMKPRKCNFCGRDYKNYRSEVVHKIAKHKDQL